MLENQISYRCFIALVIMIMSCCAVYFDSLATQFVVWNRFMLMYRDLLGRIE